MNRIKKTLAYIYREGFRWRFRLVEESAKIFASHAVRSDKGWAGRERDIDNLLSAAFELWHWELRHLGMGEVPYPFSKSEWQLVQPALKVGELCHAELPTGQASVALLAAAVKRFTPSTTPEESES